jgi:hypothetical protein
MGWCRRDVRVRRAECCGQTTLHLEARVSRAANEYALIKTCRSAGISEAFLTRCLSKTPPHSDGAAHVSYRGKGHHLFVRTHAVWEKVEKAQ